ncbi:MAG: FGGY family carbohydrate kinase [Ruminiclostridium sp.]
MDKYIIGLDSGTSGIKAVLFDLKGNEIMKQGYPLTPICQVESWYEEDVNEIWEKAKLCIAAITKKYSKESIIGIGITAQGDGLWMIDEKGEPIRNGCCFCDGRSWKQLTRWNEDGTIKKVFDLAGTRMFTGNQACILKWMEENEPENLNRAKYILHLKDYLFYKLTDKITTDATDQSLVFIDMKTRQYDDRLFNLFGLQKYKDKYAEIKSCIDNKAYLSAELLLELGLAAHTMVTSGPMDVTACALGAGVVEKGYCCSIIGTAALHEMVIAEPCSDEIFAGMTVCHSMDDRWLRLMASLAGTPNLEWLLNLFGSELKLKAAENNKNIYDYIDELLVQVPIGANGVMYHPYLLAGGERAPFIDPNARASFTGIAAKHTISDLLRACFEGVAFAMLDCYKHMPIEVEQITVCGGGAKSDVWCQMFADAVGKRVVTVRGEELGAKGAVINNAVAQGIFTDYYQGIKETVSIKKTYTCNLDNHRQYLKYYELYKKTYEVLMETWKLRHTILFD